MSNTRLTLASHALCWLEYWRREGMEFLTSEKLAKSVGSNPVSVRKVLGGVRDAGILRTGRGPGSGWALARPASEITLLDVHAALGLSGPFDLHASPPDFSCPVGGGISQTLTAVYGLAELRMAEVLREVTIELMLEDILRVNQGGESMAAQILTKESGQPWLAPLSG
jgi:DNA-binding IscR family transcriptional regulator